MTGNAIDIHVELMVRFYIIVDFVDYSLGRATCCESPDCERHDGAWRAGRTSHSEREGSSYKYVDRQPFCSTKMSDYVLRPRAIRRRFTDVLAQR